MRSKPIEVKLDPVDNLRLSRLCGALDENLRQIESALDVTIARRGGVVVMTARFCVRETGTADSAKCVVHIEGSSREAPSCGG